MESITSQFTNIVSNAWDSWAVSKTKQMKGSVKSKKLKSKYVLRCNKDYYRLLCGYCHQMELQKKLSSVIPYEVILIITEYSLFGKFETEITNKRLRESVYINKQQNIIQSLEGNFVSTIYGNIIVKDNNYYSWTVKRNKFDNKWNNFFVGIIKNDIEWLYHNINSCGWDQDGNGYFIDCVYLMQSSSFAHYQYNHECDLRMEIILNLLQGMVRFNLRINGEVVSFYKFHNIKQNEYRLAVCLFGGGTEIEIC